MLNKSLDQFFLSEESNVLVIKGDWGVGKTYTWRQYLEKNKNKEQLMKYKYVSYVSLFGVSDIDTVHKSITRDRKKLSGDQQVDGWFKKAKKSLDNFFGGEKFDKVITETFKIKAAAEYYHSIIYHSMNKSIICIDDLERKNDDLKVDQILGLIDELVEVKKCKVVLIFNEKELNKSSKGNKYLEYREKIVDIEIEHSPSLGDVFNIHFEQADEVVRKAAFDLVSQLDIKNIRVLRKIRWVIDAFWGLVDLNDFDSLKNEFVTNATFLCWAYYTQKTDAEFNEYYEILSGTSKFSAKWLGGEAEASPQEIKVRKLNLGSSIFDKHIAHFLKTGFIEKKSELSAEMSEHKKIIERKKVNEELTSIWSLYSDTFDDNLADFKKKLRDILENHMNNICLNDFDAILGFVDEEVMVVKYIEQYMELNGGRLDIDEYSPTIGRLKNAHLKQKVLELVQDKSDITIDSVIDRIVTGGWNDAEINFLSSQSVPEIITWLKSNPDDLVKKVRRGLLYFHKHEEVLYQNITNNAVSALQSIAAENTYNAKRIKNLYNIEPTSNLDKD